MSFSETESRNLMSFTVSKRTEYTLSTAAKAFLSAWAVTIACGLSLRNLCTALILLLLFLFFRKYGRLCAGSRRETILTGVIAVLGACAVVMHGRKLYTQNFDSGLFKALILLITFVGMYILLYRILLFAVHAARTEKFRRAVFRSHGAEGITGRQKDTPTVSENTEDSCKTNFAQNKDVLRPDAGAAKRGRRLAILTFAVCMLCYLPYFLYEFPGIISPDGANQIEQLMGAAPWSNHHPVAHTLVIAFWTKIGMFFTGNLNSAVAFYTAFQMLLFAASAAVIIRLLWSFGCRTWVCILTAAFYALIPFQDVFAVYILKDSFFSPVFVLFCCALLRIAQGESQLPSVSGEAKTLLHFTRGRIRICRRRDYIVFGLLSFAVCLLRSNGWYMFLFMIPFLIALLRGRRKQICAVCGLVVLSVCIVKGPVMKADGVQQPDTIESLCVPLQQIARVIVDKYPIAESDRQLISHVVNIDYVDDLYNPGFADPLKELVRAGDENYLDAHLPAFFGLWCRLGIRYPGTYMSALADLTEGYWFPDVDYETASIDGVFQNKVGLHAEPLIGGKAVVKTKEILIKLGDFIPGYTLLWNCGTYTWILVLAGYLGICGTRTPSENNDGCNRSTEESAKHSALNKKEDRRTILLVLLPSFALILTLFAATPSATEFRYMLPVVEAMPLWLVLSLTAYSDYTDKSTKVIKVTAAEPLHGHMMLVTFSTGEQRLFDATTLKGPAFAPLADDRIFNHPVIFHGVITWDNGQIDIAPETVYKESYSYNKEAM